MDACSWREREREREREGYIFCTLHVLYWPAEWKNSKIVDNILLTISLTFILSSSCAPTNNGFVFVFSSHILPISTHTSLCVDSFSKSNDSISYYYYYYCYYYYCYCYYLRIFPQVITNFNWYHCRFHIPQHFSFSSKVLVFLQFRFPFGTPKFTCCVFLHLIYAFSYIRGSVVFQSLFVSHFIGKLTGLGIYSWPHIKLT